MIDTLQPLLSQTAASVVVKNGLTVAQVTDPQQGFLLARDILYKFVDFQTIVFLSGGSQKTLYQMLAKEEELQVGAVGLVDERYGPPNHPISNERLIRESGLTKYLSGEQWPFYPMLKDGLSREETAKEYERLLRDVFATYLKKVAILGLGVDGHIAGIAPNREDLPAGEAGFTNPLFADTTSLVGQFHDPKPMSEDGNPSPPHGFGERVTLTFAGLSHMDLLLLISFGQSKKQAIAVMFTPGAEEEVPGRFLLRPDIAQKTLFITDQVV